MNSYNDNEIHVHRWIFLEIRNSISVNSLLSTQCILVGACVQCVLIGACFSVNLKESVCSVCTYTCRSMGSVYSYMGMCSVSTYTCRSMC